MIDPNPNERRRIGSRPGLRLQVLLGVIPDAPLVTPQAVSPPGPGVPVSRSPARPPMNPGTIDWDGQTNSQLLVRSQIDDGPASRAAFTVFFERIRREI